MVEEKKLTDEEIVKALKVVGKETLAFAYDKEQKQFKYVTAKEILDLIHRLQSENELLRKNIKTIHGEEITQAEYNGRLIENSLNEDTLYVIIDRCELTRENAEQKAEIERLTEKVENQKAVIKGQNKAIEKEKSENKRLYDEYVRLDDFCAGKGCLCCICECKETCNECAKCGSLKTEKCEGFRIDVSKYARAIEKADKLQKQVDELTELKAVKTVDNNGLCVAFSHKRKEVGEASVCDYQGRKDNFLHGVEVKEQYRGQGYGRRIVEYMTKHYPIDTLYVEKANNTAIRLYERFGFALTCDTFDKDGKTMAVMARGQELYNQVVKDMAKEILQYVGDLFDDGDQRFQLKDYQWHKDLCTKYGVEVE